MKKIVFLYLFLLAFNLVSAQIGGSDEVYLNGDKIEAKFQGGDINTFSEFVLNRLDKSKILKEGQLICSFTVNEEGELKNIRIVKDLGGESAFELIRVLRLAPKWQPAMRNGKGFAVDIKLPFTFKAQKSSEMQEKKSVVKKEVVEKNNNASSNDNVQTILEVQAEFEGGKKAFYDYLNKNLKFPKTDAEGRAIVSFVINEEGKAIEIKMVKDPTNGLVGNEIIRVLENCPKWKPATQKGVPVRSQFTLPFELKSQKK